MNRILMLWAFMAAFMMATPALAAPPEEDGASEKADDNDSSEDEAKAEEESDAKEESKDDAKVEETKEDGETASDTEGNEPAEIETDEEAVEAAGDLLSAIQQKHWGLALGLGLALLVFALRKVNVLAKVPKKALPWVTAVLGILGYVSAAFMVEGADMADAALGGLMTGAAAVGLWEMVLKNFLGTNSES